MAEQKAGTASNVSDIKKLEAELLQKREATKTSILAQVGEHLAELKTLGFFYSLSEAKHIGRPKKEKQVGWHNGKPTGWAKHGVKALQRKFERSHRRSFGNKIRRHPKRWGIDLPISRHVDNRPKGWFF